jgi:hypothetical protein
MKLQRLVMTVILLVGMTAVVIPDATARNCAAIKDACINQCNRDWQGDTMWDGAGRNVCRGICYVDYGVCGVVSSVF